MQEVVTSSLDPLFVRPQPSRATVARLLLSRKIRRSLVVVRSPSRREPGTQNMSTYIVKINVHLEIVLPLQSLDTYLFE